MSFIDRIVVSKGFNFIIGRRRLTRIVGWFADGNLPGFLLRSFIRGFIRKFHIDIASYDFDISKAKSFNEFFARKLRDGMRPLEDGVVSPCDGFISFSGSLREGSMLQVKGKAFNAEQLLGDIPPGFLDNSSYLIIYLSPSDYHRVHAPFDMSIDKVTYLPGTLYSVGHDTLHIKDKVYCKNERMVLEGNSPYGRFYFVMVGAMIVGRVRLSFTDLITNRKRPKKVTKEFAEPVQISRGAEVGLFEMGSTVVMICDSPVFDNISKDQGSKILLGHTLVNK